ncbi:MAG: chemotaxis protein CheW [Alicyclobacillaceae bacterium]|nr:chemotaxis protein CheW [Alicyclobacillaceae bacterium]
MEQQGRELAQEIKVIVFQLGSEEYGVEVHQVLSIERMQKITRVPRTPAFVKGVINLRGVVTPVIDLRARFGLPEVEYTEDTRIVVVSVNDMEVGLIVDAANDVIDVPVNRIDPPPAVVGGVKADYLRGVAKLDDRLLVLLNLDRVLNAQEVAQLSAMSW